MAVENDDPSLVAKVSQPGVDPGFASRMALVGLGASSAPGGISDAPPPPNVDPGANAGFEDRYPLAGMNPPGSGVDSGGFEGRAALVGDMGVGAAKHAKDLHDKFGTRLPDPAFTPGELTTTDMADFHGLRYGEQIPYSNRNVSQDLKREVGRAYGIPESEFYKYEFDHYIPLSAGGANSAKNIFPQPLEEANEKDKLELDIFHKLSAGTISQAEAVQMAKAWRLDSPVLPDGTTAIPPSARYHDAEGVVGHVLNALDYPGNIYRSMLKGAVAGADAGKDPRYAGESEWDMLARQGRVAMIYGKQAAAKDRYTSPSDLKDTATEAAGFGKVRFGVDDGKFQWGDVGDVALDLGVAVVTDPLTLVTEGVGAIGGSATRLGRGAAELAAGLKTPAAGQYARAMAAGRTVLGGALGYGAADKDAGFGERAALVLGGAALGAAAPSIVKGVAGAGREMADELYDVYAVATRGEEFRGVARESRIAKVAQDKAERIGRWIVQGRNEAMSGLEEGERDAFTSVMHDLKNATVDYREEAIAKTGMKPGYEGYDAVWNKTTAEANDYVAGKVMPEVIETRFAADPAQKARMIDAVNQMADHNTNVIARLNTEKILATAPGQAGRDMNAVLTGESALGMPGLRFHVDDFYQWSREASATSALKKAEDWRIYAARRGGQAPEMNVALNADQSYAAYAEGFAKHFLSKAEQDAIQLTGAYGRSEANQQIVRLWENYALRPFDAATNFMKAGMLYFSSSWLRTQFFDNLSKAFTEGGLGNLGRTAWDATGGAFTGVGKDIRAILTGDAGWAIKNADVLEAAEQGVLHDNLSMALRSELVGDFVHRPDQVVAEGGRLAKAGELIGSKYKEATKWVMDSNPVAKLVSGVGSYMEGAARLSTYTRTRDALVAQGVESAVAKSAAAAMVERTFFNYSNVTMLESAVMKRLMPFYTFYSKNMPYWLQAIFDPARVGRVAALDKVRQSIGTTPSQSDVKGLTPYIRANAPRKLGKDEHGNSRYLVSPVDPRVEALKMVDPKNVGETLQERGNALIKTPIELASGHDFFTDDNLYPSDNKRKDGKPGRKYLFSRGFKYTALDSMLEKLTGVKHPLGVFTDQRGNPYTTSDKLMVVDKLLQVGFPMGAVEQLAAAVGKNQHGKETPGVSVMNRLNPYQQISVSPEAQRMTKLHNAKEGHQ